MLLLQLLDMLVINLLILFQGQVEQDCLLSHHVFAGCDDVNVLLIVLVFPYFCQLVFESVVDDVLVDGGALLDSCGLPQEVLDEIKVLFFSLLFFPLLLLFLL